MTIYDGLRIVVFVVGLAAVGISLGSWAVTTRRIPPFSRLARVVRGMSDPVMVPFERWMVARGKNPQDAPWWFLGLTIIGGILVLTLGQWLIGTAGTVIAAGRSGSRGVIKVVIYLVGQIVLLALIVRVLGSWLGAGRYNRLMRPVYVLTDWIVEPLRRFIPPFGFIDITPIVAWFLLQLLLSLILRAI